MTNIARAYIDGLDRVTGLSAISGEGARNFSKNVADHAQGAGPATFVPLTGTEVLDN